MNELFPLLQELVVLYVIGLIGFITKRLGILPERTEQVLTQILLYITLPSLILYSMNLSPQAHSYSYLIILVLFSVYALAVACLMAFYLRKKMKIRKSREAVFESLIIFGNQGFIGYAVCYLLFQEEGIIYTAIFNLVYLLLIWSYGIYLFVRKGTQVQWRKVFFNPGIAATVVGVLLLFSPIKLPGMAVNLLHELGAPTIPLSMLLIGSLVGTLPIREMIKLCKQPSIWLVTITRLLIIPLSLLPFIQTNVSFPILTTAMLITGTPSASTVSLYAQKYGGDVYYASIGVLISTVCSFVTIPLLYALLMFLFH
ncbi:AEC family transporter [Bacillus sp. USDA818B3_A]|uniref:AEC family transporter n=1 Tax=Bacillus sp. USDA818B3_A TaxID=2698834 RepID=UPI00136E2CB7|nr:AEC family transporter [Bacillus sp. USDA818B3_A]